MKHQRYKPKKPPAMKLWFRISPENYRRLSDIARKYGFRSRYELGQYIVAAFLRVADPVHDKSDDPLPDEIKEMFYDLAEADRSFDFVKPKRKLPQYELDKIDGQLRIWEEG